MEKVTITPSMAKKLLEGNTKNRSVSPLQVSRFAKDMKNGNWQFNGETIKVAKDGTLLDGQHRLLACIKAETPFETAYIDNLENEVISSVDIGTRRSNGNILQMKGYKSANQVAAGAKRLIWIEQGIHPVAVFHKANMRGTMAITTKDILDFCEKHPYEVSVFQSASNHMGKIKSIGMSCAHVGLFFLLFERAANTQLATSFFEKLCDSERSFLTPPDMLRKALWESAAKMHVGQRRGDYDVPILLIKTWNAFLSGNEIKRLFVSDKDIENPPSILGVN